MPAERTAVDTAGGADRIAGLVSLMDGCRGSREWRVGLFVSVLCAVAMRTFPTFGTSKHVSSVDG